jgi:hypothetical protein
MILHCCFFCVKLFYGAPGGGVVSILVVSDLNKLKITAFWDIALCCLEVHPCLRGSYYVHHHSYFKTIRHCIPEGSPPSHLPQREHEISVMNSLPCNPKVHNHVTPSATTHGTLSRKNITILSGVTQLDENLVKQCAELKQVSLLSRFV